MICVLAAPSTVEQQFLLIATSPPYKMISSWTVTFALTGRL